MKNLRSFPLGRPGCMLGIVNALLAVAFTAVSLLYVRPKVCNQACDAPEGIPCPSGACRFGEQRAGWPLPVIVDSPGGGSPVDGWRKLGPEDIPMPDTFVLDVLFYGILLWVASCMIQAHRGRPLPFRLIAVALPLTALMSAFLWLVYVYIAYSILRIA